MVYFLNPEPIEENLSEICNAVKQNNADLGIAVNPDIDNWCLADEKGDLFGEEYTLVAYFILFFQKKKDQLSLTFQPEL